MTDNQPDMPPGLYRIHWIEGGNSLASVGITHNGTRWYAPCNWTTDSNNNPMVASTDWSKVDRIEPLDSADLSRPEPSDAARKEALEDITKARKILSDLCSKNGLYFKMSVPVDDNDSDIVLKRIIDGYEAALSAPSPMTVPDKVRDADTALDMIFQIFAAHCENMDVDMPDDEDEALLIGCKAEIKEALALLDQQAAQTFKRGDRVRKKGDKGQWHGIVCGEYSTDVTPEGYAVESEREEGSVQIYPATALELYDGGE